MDFALALGGRASKTGGQLSAPDRGAASEAGVRPVNGAVPVLMDKHIIPLPPTSPPAESNKWRVVQCWYHSW